MSQTATLAPADRKILERAVSAARNAAERGAKKALEYLAVNEKQPHPGMSDGDKKLRRELRAKSRLLGSNPEAPDGLRPLIDECAYNQWHKMLFAGFLAKNPEKSFLMHPEYGIPVTLEDCDELAIEERDFDGWATAARYTSAMFPNVFPDDDPIQRVAFFREDQNALTRFLKVIPDDAYNPDEGLGWAYQFWQAKTKKEVNESGRKVGGNDISAVTQFFTEEYMVDFLLHNTLGAWWAARHPDSPLIGEMEYLLMGEDGMPVAGMFDGWPETVAEVTVMDPSAGSGHFLTLAAELLARMREEEEGLSASEAAEAVLRDNIFGMEIDKRCTQIMAFALALWAWKRGGYRKLPIPNTVWSGCPVRVGVEEWKSLAAGDIRLENALERLHELFRDALDLGSLIDPSRLAEGEEFAKTGTLGLDVAALEEVEPLLEKALARELDEADPTGAVFSTFAEESGAVFGEAARVLVRAATLLRSRYALVLTNVPYLARGKQADILKKHLEKYHLAAKADVATAYVERCAAFASHGGTTALVTPQNWLFLGTYKNLRRRLLKTQSWNLVARLGSGAFETIGGEVVNVALLALTNTPADTDHRMSGLDVSDSKTPREKAAALRAAPAIVLPQSGQLENPDARVSVEEASKLPLLEKYAKGLAGILNGDSPRFQKKFWELINFSDLWVYQQGTVEENESFGGCEKIIFFDEENGHLRELKSIRRERLHDSDQRGNRAWGKLGVAVSSMGGLPISMYTGNKYDSNVAVVLPEDTQNLPAIWAFCSSPEYNEEVRKIDQALKVTNSALVKVPFDLERWRKVAEERYPDGLPQPYSDDPTQWLFHGHPARAGEGTALHVAVARLLGYRWPAEADGEAERMVLSREGREWVARAAGDRLDGHTDPDGIVCLPAVAGERPAAERLRALLAAAWDDAPEEWSHPVLERLLSEAGSGGGDLGSWLWRDFFKGHARLFHNRPFVWHVTDGRKDGFSALVNYHKLDYRLLGRLIYTYLGAWIEAQRSAAEAGETGADLRLAAATDLQKRLIKIQEGEPPHDIYIRWKKKSEQPIGWNPDTNDGVRINIRPFVEAGVLRSKFTINWRKDRGKNPDGTERHNECHLTISEKEAARGAVSG